MAQPIHFSYPISCDFGPEAIVQRPTLALHIPVISALWNSIDAKLASLLVALLDAEARTGMAMYFSLQSDSAKRASFNAVTSAKMTKAEQDAFLLILNDIRKRAAERNNVIHGAWGISPAFPDKLLWCDIKDWIWSIVGLAEELTQDSASERFRARLLEGQKRMLVFGERDFLDIEDRLRGSSQRLTDFSMPFVVKQFGQSSTSGWRVDPPRSE